MRKIFWLILVMSLSDLVAAEENYFPPKQIVCSVTGEKTVCSGFNHAYLIEEKNSDIPHFVSDTFHFTYGIAFDPDRKVIYGYSNSQGYQVKLNSSYAEIQPDFRNSNWVKQGARKHFYYTCKEEGAQCPITNLPFSSDHSPLNSAHSSVKEHLPLEPNVVSHPHEEKKFSIYVTNHTPFVVHLGKSRYNQTTLNLSQTEVKPYAQLIKIGEGETMDSRTAIAFYAQVGELQSYWNTPLVTYKFEPLVKSARVEPQELFIDVQKYYAGLLFGPDGNRDSIELNIHS